MEPVETITVEETVVACDGGNVALGHPRVFLHIGTDGDVTCPYCGRHYILKEGAASAGAHH